MTTDQAIREAKNRWARRRRRLIGYGQWQPFTDAAPAREHVLAIKATGMGLAGIAKHTGVKRGSLDHLLYGKDNLPPAVKIRTENAEALLTYWPTLDDYEDHNTIDGTGTRRRMQALAAAGFPSRAVHRIVDTAHAQTFERLYACDKVTARLARAVRDFYDECSAKKPERYGVEAWIADRCRANAVKRGWALPIAWDDDTIDDPEAEPDLGQKLNFHERAALRREEIEHLAWCGHTAEQILDRLNGEVSISTVRQIVHEWRTGQKRDRKQVAA